MNAVVTALLLGGYVGICEYRAPSPWTTCDNRWSLAIGVVLQPAGQAAAAAAAGLAARVGSARRRPPADQPANSEAPQP
jgi:hypothetical protein